MAGSKPVSPLTKDTSRVQSKGEESYDDYLQAWQDMFSKEKETSERGEIITYSTQGASFESTGTTIDLMEASELSTLSSVSPTSTSGSEGGENGGEDDNSGWFGGLKDWFGNAFGWISDHMMEIITGIFATIAAFLAVFYGGLVVESAVENINALRQGRMTFREGLARLVRFDINKFINERTQTMVFTKTFSELNEQRKEGELKGFRERIGALSERVVTFDLVRTLTSSAVQKIFLTISLDRLNDTREAFNREYFQIGTGEKMRVHVRKTRDFTQYRVAHIVDMIVKFDIFEAMNEMVQKAINTDIVPRDKKAEEKSDESSPNRDSSTSRIENNEENQRIEASEDKEKANTAENQRDKADTANTDKDSHSVPEVVKDNREVAPNDQSDNAQKAQSESKNEESQPTKIKRTFAEVDADYKRHLRDVIRDEEETNTKEESDSTNSNEDPKRITEEQNEKSEEDSNNATEDVEPEDHKNIHDENKDEGQV